MRRIVSVDSGKFATKGAIRGIDGKVEKKIKFLTKIDKETVDFGMLGNESTHFVTFEGARYRVGDGAENESYSETKQEDIHKICTYTALALLGVQNGDSVILGIGCPLSIFKNKKAREEYGRFIGNSHEPVTIVIDGRKITFVIEKTVVFPESAGIVYLDFDKYKEKTVGVIDIGGLNTNCCVYQKIAPVPSTIFTTRLGGKEMFKTLLDKLNSSLNLSSPIADYQMNDIMESGFVFDRRDKAKEQKSKKIIHDYRLQHIQEVYDSCVKHNWAVDNMEIVFVGGTSLLLKEEIKEVFGVDDSYFYEGAEFLNCLGYLRALS